MQLTNWLVAGLLLCHGAVWACESQLNNILRKAHPEKQVVVPGTRDIRAIDRDSVVCKVWPANESLTIVALALDDTEGEARDLEILVTDSRTGEIRSRLYQPGAIDEDAIRFAGLQIDTARYQLNENVRAFGIRLARTGSSRPNPYGNETLNLYTLQHLMLKPVLNSLEMHVDSGEWDTRCAGEFETINRTLSIGEPGTSGYANLLLAEKGIKTINRLTKGGCEAIERDLPRQRYTLRFDGNQYRVPKALAY